MQFWAVWWIFKGLKYPQSQRGFSSGRPYKDFKTSKGVARKLLRGVPKKLTKLAF